MDGIHDLGGKLGYGAVETSGDEEAPFHAPWEARMWGIAFAYTRPSDFNAPKFRYTRELETPLRYLSRPYLDQWYKAHACMLLGAELVTLAELASGESDAHVPDPSTAPQSAADVHRVKHRTPPSLRSDTVSARYRSGDKVRTRLAGSTGHTRLPAYARGHRGVVAACHGGHPLDDAAAAGEIRIEPLYTIAFAAADLFPECAGSADRVHLEAWESYLHDAD